MKATAGDQEEVYQEGKRMWKVPDNLQGAKPSSGIVFGATNFLKELFELLGIRKN